MDLTGRINNFIEKQQKLGRTKMPKTPTTSIPRTRFGRTGVPRTSRTFRPEAKFGEVISEVGRQLTPKGPYRSPYDIASDITESQRMAKKITGFLSRNR